MASSFSKTSWLHPNTLKTSSVGSSWFFDTPGTHGVLVKNQVQKAIVSQPQWVLRLESYKALFFLFELISNILTFSIFFSEFIIFLFYKALLKTFLRKKDSCQFITRTWQKFATLFLKLNKSSDQKLIIARNEPFICGKGFMKGNFSLFLCQRPYHVEYTSSRPITEVKQHWA